MGSYRGGDKALTKANDKRIKSLDSYYYCCYFNSSDSDLKKTISRGRQYNW